MQSESLFVSIQESFGSSFMDNLSHIGHHLPLDIYHIKTIRFRILQFIGIFE